MVTAAPGWHVDPNDNNKVVQDTPAATGTTNIVNEQGDQLVPTPTPYIAAIQAKAANQNKPGYDALGNPLAPPSEPAVLSSTNISDNVIPANADKLATVSKKGTYVGGDGNMYYSDGSLVPAPANAVYDGTSGSYTADGEKYGTAPQYLDNPDNDPDVDNENQILSQIKSTTDANTFRQISAIEQQYDSLRADQLAANKQAEQSRARTLIVSGTSRYSPLTAAGTNLSQASYGLRQIQKLDADENSAIATAQEAQQNNDMELMSKALTFIDQTRQAKAKAAADISTQLKAASDAADAARVKASRDNAVADLMSQGVTDPAQMLDYLNNKTDTSATGGNFTAAEISSAMKDLTPQVKDAKDLYSFSNENVGKLLAAGLNGDQIQQVQDYYNGHAEAPQLTTAQVAVVQKALSGVASAVGTADDSTAVPPWDEYLQATQKELGMSLDPNSDTYKQLRAGYDQLSSASVGKLTNTEKNTLDRAGLTAAADATKAYFLSTPPAFQDSFSREMAQDPNAPAPTLDNMHKAYTDWQSAQQNSGSSKLNRFIQALSAE